MEIYVPYGYSECIEHMEMMFMIISNDNMILTPVTDYRASIIEFDFPSIKIGIAEYSEGPTGCTVFIS